MVSSTCRPSEKWPLFVRLIGLQTRSCHAFQPISGQIQLTLAPYAGAWNFLSVEERSSGHVLSLCSNFKPSIIYLCWNIRPPLSFLSATKNEFQLVNGNFRIPKWRYCTIFVWPYFWRYIPFQLGLAWARTKSEAKKSTAPSAHRPWWRCCSLGRDVEHVADQTYGYPGLYTVYTWLIFG